MSRFSQFVEEYGLTLADFEFGEDEEIILSDSGIAKVEERSARTYHDADCDCPTCVTNDALGYDADVSDPSQYCRHGTFIGSWWGPDYLCGKCEMGE